MAALILKLRIFLLVIIPAVFVTLLALAPPRRFDSSIESMTDPNDPALLLLHAFRDTFGSEEDLIVGIEAEDVFAPEVLAAIDQISTEIADLDHVAQVISITTTQQLVGGEGFLGVEPLVDTLPRDIEAGHALRDRVLKRNLYKNQLVSADGRVASMVIRLDPPEVEAGAADWRVPLTEAMQQILDRHCPRAESTCHLVGSPMLKAQLVSMSRGDNQIFLPLVGGLIGLVLFLVFRSLIAVVLAGLAVTMSLEITMCLFRLSDRLMNMVTVIITPLVLVIGLTAAIHLLSRYGELLRAGAEKREALEGALGHVGLATLLTSATTAAGFLSLTVSPVIPIKEFGIFAALGIMVTLVVSMTFIPAALSVLPLPRQSPAMASDASWTGRVVRFVAALTRERRRAIWLVTGVVVALCLVVIPSIKVETYAIKFFHPDHPLYVAYMFVDEKLSGAAPLEILFESDTPGTFKEPAVLEGMERYRRWLEARPEPGKVMGLSNLVMELNRAVEGGGEAHYRLPATRPAVAQYLLLYEGAGDDQGIDLFNYVTDDFTAARLSARLHLTSSAGFVRLHDELVAFREAHPIPNVRVRFTGAAILYGEMVDKLLQSQVESFGLALVVIFLMLSALFRSLKTGAVAMIPNVIPITIAGGVMGWTGFDLTISTAMIASVAIGIAVDDTIHFLVRFRHEESCAPDTVAACERVITTTGRPVIFTSLVISAGFLILCISSFRPNLEFGLLTAIAMLAAMVGDLTVTPAVLVFFRPRMGKKGGER